MCTLFVALHFLENNCHFWHGSQVWSLHASTVASLLRPLYGRLLYRFVWKMLNFHCQIRFFSHLDETTLRECGVKNWSKLNYIGLLAATDRWNNILSLLSFIKIELKIEICIHELEFHVRWLFSRSSESKRTVVCMYFISTQQTRKARPHGIVIWRNFI